MSEARQRWRIVVRRGEAARALAQRDVEAAWEEGLARAGVPVATTRTTRPRPRIAFAAPVPIGMTAEREPVDLFLAERLTVSDLRRRLAIALPIGHELVDLYDVWLGEPAIAGRVIAADYRVEVAADREELKTAVVRLIQARQLERPRKGEETRTYDLRPLVAELEVGPALRRHLDQGGPQVSTLWMRLRHDPGLGVGRPDEVLAALEVLVGHRIEALETVRERVWLAGEPVTSAAAVPARFDKTP